MVLGLAPKHSVAAAGELGDPWEIDTPSEQEVCLVRWAMGCQLWVPGATTASARLGHPWRCQGREGVKWAWLQRGNEIRSGSLGHIMGLDCQKFCLAQVRLTLCLVYHDPSEGISRSRLSVILVLPRNLPLEE